MNTHVIPLEYEGLNVLLKKPKHKAMLKYASFKKKKTF